MTESEKIESAARKALAEWKAGERGLTPIFEDLARVIAEVDTGDQAKYRRAASSKYHRDGVWVRSDEIEKK